ncbi:pre-mRNA-processing factor 39 [Neocloeon triangulifer]|uniref:pre-mRNA-processing factor 39 n=1 Tax=Neocloeon triangulifer TaxID=2078957 RepID=UPI00286F0A70|nr:pre-mRNA-processing factor 39 [Neocloeon triangulifer]
MASDSENDSSGEEEVAPARRTRSTRASRAGKNSSPSPSKPRGRGRGGGRRGKGRGRGKAAKPETESEEEASDSDNNKANGVDEDVNNIAEKEEEAEAFKEEVVKEVEPEVQEESSSDSDQKPAESPEQESAEEEIVKEEVPKFQEELPAPVVAQPKEEPMETDENNTSPEVQQQPEVAVAVKEELVEEAKEDKGEKRKRRGFSDTPPDDVEQPPKKSKEINGDSIKEEERKKRLPELEKYWKAVKDDSADFTGWTYLLQYVDQESDAEAAREAYNAFLSLYPYCYGYWRKYADYEKKKGEASLSDKVFERGLKAIPLSVDLWLHFLNHCKTNEANDAESIRAQYERALKTCGMEFRSDRLWESYLKWEAEQKNWPNMLSIYDRLLSTPTQGYTAHFDSFEAFAKEHLPQKLLSVDEFLELRKEWLLERRGDDGDNIEERQKEEVTALRDRVIELRKAVHKATVKSVADRWVYEEAIKRPYFHVKPLEKGQLKNWKDYLDYEIEQGDRQRIIVLFERCLIACALYDEYWIKFLDYLEGQKDDGLIDKISNVYNRACTIHHPKKPALQLRWAAFEEGRGHLDSACEILEGLDKRLPNTLQVAYQRINLERRRGCLDKVSSLYEGYISSYKNVTIASALSVKYARFLCKFKNDADAAQAVLVKAMEKDRNSSRLFLNLIDIHLQKSHVDVTSIVAIFDRFLQLPDAPAQQKHVFAQRKLEFLEDFGPDVASVFKAKEEVSNWHKAAKDAKKETKEDGTSKDGSGQPVKKAKTEYSSQTAAGYGGQQPYNYQGYQQGGYYGQGDYYNWQQYGGYAGGQNWGGGGGGGNYNYY